MKQIELQFSNWLEPRTMNILGVTEYKQKKYMLLQEDKSVDNSITIVHFIPDENGEDFEILPVYDREILEHFAGELNSALLKQKNKNK